MATWKILCKILYAKKNDNSIFPDLELKKDELHFEENSVIKISAFARELAAREFQKNCGYCFYAIDRTDKNTGKDYYSYIDSSGELKTQLNSEQQKVLKGIKSDILNRVIISEEEEKDLLSRYYIDGLVKKVNQKFAVIQDSGSGKIMPHSLFDTLKNFYDRITPIEIQILNLDDEITVDDYDELRQYIAKMN